jgi:hypothetical protein
LAALEAATAVFASVVGQAIRTNPIAAFVANIPFASVGKLFPAALTRNIDHSFTI